MVREGPRPRLPDALGARLHALEPDAPARRATRLRPRRLGRLARDRGSRCAGRLVLRDEQDVARDDGRLARSGAGRRAVRGALTARDYPSLGPSALTANSST